jgi:polar amino acid transport system substrate-binding protein
MKQLIQNFKTGELLIDEVPSPAIREAYVLVENAFSLISAGTEKSTVSTAKMSLAGKAKSRPDLVKQVMDNIRKEGLSATLAKVQNKLDAPKALGYSCAGTVLNSRDWDGKFKKGDRVACAGQDYASHAQVVCVPQNLVVKIPDNVSFGEAAFTTVGAIALQGVRQADPKIGEKICVIGLGLIGQITSQILKSNGCSVCGLDVNDYALKTAEKIGIDKVVNINDSNLLAILGSFAANGFDKVIITASTSDNSPLILASEILRRKGVIIVVGNVKMDIPREPYFYKKELELKIATSYGPGRYDPVYEEAGLDYPYAYVRFTENRNMEVFLDLVSRGRVDVKGLTTHVFDFEKSLDAYDLILGKRKEPYTGILLKYDSEQGSVKSDSKIVVNSAPVQKINAGFVGLGSFASGYLLPYLKTNGVSLDTVVTTRGITSSSAAKKFKFNIASTDPKDVMSNPQINTVFVATRHNSHAGYVLQALAAGKNVFVEKPLALNIDELKKIASVYKSQSVLTAGFNRRFAPVSRKIKENFTKLNSPLIMNFRVNAGFIPAEHWIHDPQIGGGRIIGEACHFIDLMSYFSGGLPVKVQAQAIKSGAGNFSPSDNFSAVIEFSDGSVGTLIYTAMGDKAMEKERLEIFCAGNSYLINDFKEGEIFSSGRASKIANSGKGHKQEVEAFIKAVNSGSGNPIDVRSLLATTLATFKIEESLGSGLPQIIDVNQLY